MENNATSSFEQSKVNRINPWILINAIHEGENDHRWGLPVELGKASTSRGSRPFKQFIIEEED